MRKTCYVVIPTRESTGLIAISAGKVFRTEEPACEYAIELVDNGSEYISASVLLFGSPLDGDAPEMVYGYSREKRTW